jgi:hypothetical protein
MADARSGQPVKIEIAGGPLPAEGADLTRTLTTPVPKGRLAALAYFDAGVGLWRPVATKLSKDRRVLTAHVNHFTLFDDLEYGAAWLFDKRVEPPACDAGVPRWVMSTTFLDDKNGPLRWCVGRDRKDQDLLEVRLAVNRSYGMGVRLHAETTRMEDSMLQGGTTDIFLAVADRRVAADDRDLAGRLIVAGGAEATVVFSEQQVRAGDGTPLISVDLSAKLATIGVTYQLLSEGLDRAGKAGAAAVAIAAMMQCDTLLTYSALTRDWVGVVNAVARCALDQLESITINAAGILVKAFPDKDPKKLGELTGRIGSKFMLAWTAGTIVQPLLTYALVDSHLDKAAFNLSVQTKPVLSRTFITYEQPIAASGNLSQGYRIVKRYRHAGCSQGSDIDAPGAYRCFFGNTVTDPCWQIGSSRKLVCPEGDQDYSTRLIQLEVDEALEPPTRFGTARVPSAVQLEDGSRCTSIKGTHDSLPSGRVVDYYCGNGSNLAVMRGINRSKPVWTAKAATYRKGRYSNVQTVRLKRAWIPRR